jgi:branched-chain amino acid aminotransferase
MVAAMEFVSMTNVDGLIRPTVEAHVPVMDRGFLFGDSIYEVFRTYSGVPLFLDEHWTRFENSARLSRIEIGMTQAQMNEEIRQTVQASNAPNLGMDVCVRYIVTRGEGPLDLVPGADIHPRYLVIVNEVPSWDGRFYSQGVKLAVVATRRNSGDALDPNIKGGNYLNNVLGVMEARDQGADDCLMLNDADLVTESSNSNIFFVIDGNLTTPSQTARNLRGLTKAAVHTACAAHGLLSYETEITLDDVQRASECFVTSATREVMPVRTLRLDEGTRREFPDGGGDVTRKVIAYYREYVDDYVREHAALSLF